MITNDILNCIKNKSLIDFPNETCGFVVEDNDKSFCLPVKNIAFQPQETFRIKSADFLKIKDKYKKIHYIYHSHTNHLKDFSDLDIKTSNATLVPFILYCVGIDEFNFYYPKEG